MKQIKSMVLIMVISALFAFQCDNKRDCCVPPLCSEKSTLTGVWKLKGFQNPDTGNIDENPDPKNRGVEYTFADDEKTGTISGHTVANEVSGAYELKTGCTISFISFGGTKVGEDGWSSQAWIPSGKTGFYQISGNSLVLYFDDASKRMIFQRN